MMRLQGRIVVRTLSIVVLIVLIYKLSKHNKEEIKYEKGEPGKNVPLPVLFRDVSPEIDGENIYLLETSNSTSISTKYMCAIESHCKLNPEATVFFMVLVDTFAAKTILAIEELRSKYKNLQVLKMDVPLTLQDTPLSQFLTREGFWKAGLIVTNLSDLMRSAIVFKAGGYYSDTDTIALQTVKHSKNFIVEQEADHLGSAGFHFYSAHPFIGVLMVTLLTEMKLEEYGTGVLPYTTALEKHCTNYKRGTKIGFNENIITTENCTDVPFVHATSKLDCADVALYDPSVYYAVHWAKAVRLFKMTAEKLCITKLFEHSLGIHWGHSMYGNMVANHDSAIETISLRCCPIIYNYGDSKGVFSVPNKL